MPYEHLTELERCRIDDLARQGLKPAQIARRIGRHRSTIGRELERNRISGRVHYCGVEAQHLADTRRLRSVRPWKMLDGELAAYVWRGLQQGWSPQQIAGRIRRDHRRDSTMRISHEAIYQWVYHNDWHRPVRLRRGRRWRQERQSRQKRMRIPGSVSIERRPKIVEHRRRYGDWESDTLCGKPGSGGLATHVERKSRYLIALKLTDHTARQFTQLTLAAFSNRVPARLCQTLTSDNGSEFAQFKRLQVALGLVVYFAHPHSPWERGANENTNGLLREYFPKGTDFRKVGEDEVAKAESLLNNRPRKCLGYKTPAEVLSKIPGVALRN